MGTTSTVDQDLVDLMESFFASCERSEVARGEEPFEIDRQTWHSLTELGLSRLTGSEDSGGSGGSWHDAAVLLSTAAAAAVPTPVVEHDLLAGWLLTVAGQKMEGALCTAGIVDASGHASHVPWASEADHTVLLRCDDGLCTVAQVSRAQARLTPGYNLAGEARDSMEVDLDSLCWYDVPDGTADEFLLRGALARTLQVCGAMEKIVHLCVAHTGSRVQFGRNLGKFQAIQELVADLAAEASLARAAADAAVSQVVREGWSDEGTAFSVAVAKSCAGHAATTVVRNSHQVHGAIGTTYEHALHRYTKPVLAWRSEFGSVRDWDNVLAQAASTAGSADAWRLITDGQPISRHLPR